jgi:hypothetical protein
MREREENPDQRRSLSPNLTPEILPSECLFRMVFSRDTTGRNSSVFHIGYENPEKTPVESIFRPISSVSQPVDDL